MINFRSTTLCVAIPADRFYGLHAYAIHARLAGEDILNCVVQYVSHVKHTGDVWWRDDNRDTPVRFSAVEGLL